MTDTDPYAALAAYPWWAYVAAASAALTTLGAFVVSTCSVLSKILDAKRPDGTPWFNFPRLHIVVDAVALNRKPSP